MTAIDALHGVCLTALQDNPFLLLMAYDEVHVPLFASASFVNTVSVGMMWWKGEEEGKCAGRQDGGGLKGRGGCVLGRRVNGLKVKEHDLWWDKQQPYTCKGAMIVKACEGPM